MNRKIVFTPLTLLFMTLFGACLDRPTDADKADQSHLPDSVGLVLQVTRTSKLYTAEYQVHKIVTHNDVRLLHATIAGKKFETPLPLGDRKIAIPIDVTLRAYIDFSNFSTDNIERSADGTTLHVTLPDPKVVVTASDIDHAGTQQFVDFFRSDFTDEEMMDFTRQGVDAVLNMVPEMGIIETARESAAATLIPLFARMGYQEERIVVTFRKEFTGKDIQKLYDREHSVLRLSSFIPRPSSITPPLHTLS